MLAWYYEKKVVSLSMTCPAALTTPTLMGRLLEGHKNEISARNFLREIKINPYAFGIGHMR